MTSQIFERDDRSVSGAIVQVLEEAGVEVIFGLPGGNMVWSIFDALHEHPTIRTVMVREEGTATAMAEAYARLTGKLGVAVGQAPWLLGGGAMGILEARMSGSPILLLTDLSDGAPFTHHGPYQAATGGPGGWDVGLLAKGIASFSFVSRTPTEAVQQTQLAAKFALSGARGPAVLMYHSEALREELPARPTPTLYETRRYLAGGPAPDPTAIERAAELIRASQRPVLVAGNGVRAARAQEELRRFAAELEVPVVTTAGGKGVIAESEPRALGVFGTFGASETNRVVAEADLVLAVGTRLSPTDTAGEAPELLDPLRQTFVQLDVEQRHAAWTFPVDVAVIGDAGRSLSMLRERLRGYSGGDGDRVATAAPAVGEGDALGPLRPSAVVAALRSSLPDDAIVTCDAGENRLFMMRHFEVRTGGEYLQPAGMGGMGYALPAALAAKLAEPGRAVVAVCGDGGMSMSFAAAISAVEQRLPVIVVVINNGALGWVINTQGEREIASRLQETDFAAMVAGAGWSASTCRSVEEVKAAIGAAVGASSPTLIDARVALDVETHRGIEWQPTAA